MGNAQLDSQVQGRALDATLAPADYSPYDHALFRFNPPRETTDGATAIARIKCNRT
jgi:hypothetical protein